MQFHPLRIWSHLILRDTFQVSLVNHLLFPPHVSLPVPKHNHIKQQIRYQNRPNDETGKRILSKTDGGEWNTEQDERDAKCEEDRLESVERDENALEVGSKVGKDDGECQHPTDPSIEQKISNFFGTHIISTHRVHSSISGGLVANERQYGENEEPDVCASIETPE